MSNKEYFMLKDKVGDKKIIILGALGLILVLGLIFGSYKYYNLSKDFHLLESKLQDTEKNLTTSKSENTYLLEKFTAEQTRNNEFADTIQGIVSTVGTLDKLSKTDKELLQKYSKVYFLNEHYVPESLATITPEYVFEKDRVQKIHSKVSPYFDSMIKDAKNEGINILVVSSFRSFGEQGALKNGYVFTYGTGANIFSADQGYSEHQLGTTLDFTTSELGSSFTNFEKSAGYTWLRANAYKYGFILSYPKGNAYYTFEPWHWRFVGKKLALRLHNEGESFYDVDQRIIDNYLINIFD